MAQDKEPYSVSARVDSNAQSEGWPTDWADVSVSDETRNLVARLNDMIEASAVKIFRSSAFYDDYGVERIMIVGSTSRATYAGLPVDFDLAVLTKNRQREISDAALQRVTDKLVQRISAEPDFADYCKILDGPARVDAKLPVIALASLGLRGTESLVARYDLVIDAEGEQSRSGFLDVTCGRLPHLMGYEMFMHDLFERIGVREAHQLRRNIALTKIVLETAGGIYGSKARGLRGHGVEQLILRSGGYRHSGQAIGSFDDAMRLIFENGTAAVSGGAIEIRCFEDFKNAYPLWRPGGDDREGRPVNLWNLLGDGIKEAAEERWRRLVNVAIAYQNCVFEGRAWGVADVVAMARSLSAA